MTTGPLQPQRTQAFVYGWAPPPAAASQITEQGARVWTSWGGCSVFMSVLFVHSCIFLYSLCQFSLLGKISHCTQEKRGELGYEDVLLCPSILGHFSIFIWVWVIDLYFPGFFGSLRQRRCKAPGLNHNPFPHDTASLDEQARYTTILDNSPKEEE